jgi:uncharacterized protein YPO0396
MEMQQMFEQLLAGQTEMVARLEKKMDAYNEKMDACHEKVMAMLDAHRERTMACLGQMEANTEKIDPGMMQFAEEHQDVPNEDVAVMPVKGLKKRRPPKVPNLCKSE